MRLRFGALVVGCVVLIAAWFAFGFRPARTKLNTVNADVKTREAEVASLTTKLAELKELQRRAPELRAARDKLTVALPADPKVPDFIRFVQDQAESAGIDFLSIAPSLPAAPSTTTAVAAAPAPTSSPAPGSDSGTAVPAPAAPVSPYQTISMQISAQGPFFAIEDFVNRIERLRRAARIDNLTLNASGGASSGAAGAPAADTGGISASMKLQVFVRGTQSAAAPTTQSQSGAPLPN